jgi:uncharacterized membrane protein
MELYDWLVLAHVLAAIIWVGGGIMQTLSSRRVAAVGGDSARRAFADIEEWSGTRIFGPAAATVLVFGLLMVWQSDAWSFVQTWVWLSLVLAVAAMIVGAAFYGPEGARIGALTAERGPDDPEVKRRVARVAMVNNIDVAVMVVIVFLMVFKPGV